MAGLTSMTAREKLAQHLEETVLSGELPPGSKLPSERELAERFGASRPIVREVLSGLVERGLVDVRAGRGAFVRGARPSDAARPLGALFRRQNVTPHHVVVARSMLECEAAALASTHAEADDLEALESALADFDRASGIVEQSLCDVAFHMRIARASRNPVIATMFSAIVVPTFELMLRSLGDSTVAERGLPYHREILDAIRARDAEHARQAMAGHLSVAGRTYGADYMRDLDGLAHGSLRRTLGPGLDLEASLAAALDRIEAGKE
jgi:GntR family transcriptional repressor for pyruvate dehydrogenase complex